MKRFFGSLAVLGSLAVVLLVAAPVMAGPIISTQIVANWDTPNLLTVELVVVSSDGDVVPITGFGAALTLSGAGASGLTLSTANINSAKSELQIGSLVEAVNTAGSGKWLIGNNPNPGATANPGSYAFVLFSDNVNINGNSFIPVDGNGSVAATASSDAIVGKVVAIWQFSYVGAAPTQPVIASVSGDSGNPAIHFDDMNTNWDSYVGTVANNNSNIAVVPEPATMGLLGLGLIGLVARRKK